MKTIKFLAAGAALFTLCMTGCNKNEDPGANAGKQVTMTLQATGSQSQSRADYTPGTDGVMAFSWRTNDKVSVVVNGVSGNENCELETVKQGKIAPFSGTVTRWSESKDIYAFYPYSATGYAVTGGDNSATATAVLTLPSTQTYTIGGAVTNSFMVGTGTATASGDGVSATVSMEQVMSIIKLNIINAPGAVKSVRLIGTEAIFPTQATVKLSDATITSTAVMTNQLSMEVTDGAGSTGAKEVSFAMFPTNLSGKDIKVEVSFVNGEMKTLTKNGIDFARNVHYTVGFDAEAAKWPSMSFKITTTDTKFILPFNLNTATGNYTLDIDWGDLGDGGKTTIAPSTTSTEEDLTHTYSVNGTYTITISSSQTDNTMAQIPGFKPGKYNTSSGNNKKLISLDTPLLNTGETNLSSCFSGCSGLTGLIPAGLFDNNPGVTNFNYCFAGCSGLTGSIPAGLFDKNTVATNFTSCFSGCSGLTGSIPAGLFDKNPGAIRFIGCFEYCSGLTGSIPAGLFDKNTLVTDFTGCFYHCSGLTGLIPAGLFDKNTVATDFNNCFNGCTKLVLNSNIFCDEASGKATRFLNTITRVYFGSCFNGVGSDVSVSNNAGTAPALWEYEFGTSSPAPPFSEKCYQGIGTVTNAGVIPGGWKQ